MRLNNALRGWPQMDRLPAAAIELRAKVSRKLSLPTDLKPDLDVKENSVSHSGSSSVVSIDRESREAITSLLFSEVPMPGLWVGTSQGTVLSISFILPAPGEQRLLQPIVAVPNESVFGQHGGAVGSTVASQQEGTLFRLKGSIQRLAFLDRTGALLPPAHETWWEPNEPKDPEEREEQQQHGPPSVSPPPSSRDTNSTHFAVFCSEKQAEVVALPSQTRLSKHAVTEASFALRTDVVQLDGAVCLACFCANGHITVFSLPSLRPLLDVSYLPLTDMRIARTFCFSNSGQALYMASPTEIQRITYSHEMCDNLQEMLGELFTPVETPEAPNRGFFKGLFGGAAQTMDREDLFGEVSAGKASRSLAQHTPGSGGIEGVKGSASNVVGELAHARIALDERGQKLSELEERTAAMMHSADSFSKHAHDVMLKYKDKKWYQL